MIATNNKPSHSLNDTRSINVALSPTVETILNCVLIYAGIMRGFAKIIEILRLKYIWETQCELKTEELLLIVSLVPSNIMGFKLKPL